MSNTTALIKDNFDSISEGCFLVMPGKKRQHRQEQPQKAKKAKTATDSGAKVAQHSAEIASDGFQQLFNGEESIGSMLYRKNAFKESWDDMNNTITNILLDMNHAAVENICQFVDKGHDVDDSMVSLPFHEIPTGLVFAGINTPDHAAQFSHIVEKLMEDPTIENERNKKNFVCLLQSKDCSNIKNMFKTMIEKFLENTPNALRTDLNQDVNMDDHEENEDDADDEDIIRITERPTTSYQLGGALAKPSRCLPYDMQLLEGWYRHHQRSYSTRPNLVIILQDFESFEPVILQDFFTICSEYRSRLPIICLMGVATSTEILHQSLTKATISLLRIEKFKLEQSKVWFNRVIEKVFLDGTTHTLKFGPGPYKFLMDHFFLYDYSMSKVTASLKYALMHHYYGNPLSIFLPLLKLDEIDMTATITQWMEDDLISEHHITHIRMLGSFRYYVESLVSSDPKKALRLLEDDEFLMTKTIPSLLCDITLYQKQFKIGFELLVLLQAQFPSFSNLKKTRLMLLLDMLEVRDGLAEDTDIVRRLITFVRKIDIDHVGKLLTAFRQLFSNNDYNDVNEPFLDQITIWDARYKEISEADEAYVAKMDRRAKLLEGLVLEDEGSRSTVTAKKVQNQSIEQIKQRGTEANKIAIDIADWCDKTLGHLLRSFTKLPLYELVYYTNITLQKKSFASQPRASTQTALTQPQHYIGCSCCNVDKGDQIISSEHDTCILYKLYLECGRLINLYDWFVAFGCIIEREKRSANHKLEENEVQARFIRSVAELQFLGFIKPTQRKTDHVIRLTWSNI